MLLKLGRDVAPYKIYLMVHILMLLSGHMHIKSVQKSVIEPPC